MEYINKDEVLLEPYLSKFEYSTKLIEECCVFIIYNCNFKTQFSYSINQVIVIVTVSVIFTKLDIQFSYCIVFEFFF